MIAALDDTPDVVAVVPTLGGAVQRLRTCLDSVLASRTGARLAVVVVWNDPRRDVPADLPGPVTVLEPGLNLGFPGGLAHARTAAARRAPGASRIWLVQDDVTVEPGCLDRLLDRLLDRRTANDTPGVVAPVAVDDRGLVRARTRGGVLDAAGGMDHWFPLEDVAPEDLDTGYRLDYVASSGALVDLAAWDAVGGFDAAYYPLLWSDVDFCFRAGRAGFGAVLEPSAKIRHTGNASTPGLLSQHVANANAERFRRVFAGEPPPVTTPVTAEPTLVAAVAQVAGSAVVDVAALGTRLIRERDEVVAALAAQRDDLAAQRDDLAAQRDALAPEVERLRAELDATRATVSWRVTAPLRAVRRRGRRSVSP